MTLRACLRVRFALRSVVLSCCLLGAFASPAAAGAPPSLLRAAETTGPVAAFTPGAERADARRIICPSDAISPNPPSGTIGGASPVLSAVYAPASSTARGYLTFRIYQGGTLVTGGDSALNLMPGQTGSWQAPPLAPNGRYFWTVTIHDFCGDG